jgi:hypothetical protein
LSIKEDAGKQAHLAELTVEASASLTKQEIGVSYIRAIVLV